MVAVIHSSSSLRNILNYNEQKVKQGLATCLEAAEYPKDAADLNFYQKLSRLEKLTELNQQTKVNSVHISLNFDPSEQLSEERLKEIAAVYMDKIGFAGQPYLLYRHTDAGHPHIHLVTTNIKPDGKRIELHNLGRNQSEKARKEIEIAFSLIKAEESRQREAYRLKPVDARKVVYGRVESKRAMSNVITTVLKNYKYGSLAELNAVLQLYNVTADRGSEDSRIFRHQGLVYRILDGQGNRVGVPVKASDFHFKPTLKYLAEKFVANAAGRDQYKARLRNTIDLALLGGELSLTGLIEKLQKEGIDTVLRQNAEGVIYGITYVDHRSRCVFNGSAIGKTYSAKAILERCASTGTDERKIKNGKKENERVGGSVAKAQKPGYEAGKRAANAFHNAEKLPDMKELSDALLQPEEQPERMDWELKRKRKKKKRQRIEP
ncbi:MAG: relaxase [Mucilaginibacter sp.]|nr:relaxase [Mucilaginibacter sp.]